MKVYTICGSLKFEDEMKKVASLLEAEEGICVLAPFSYDKKYKNEIRELENIYACHMKKIELADAIYVMNVDGYIGESTKSQINYAKKLKKEIVYYKPVKE